MSVLIKMEMPKSCMECRLCNKPTFDFSAYCSAKVRDIQNWEIKQDWCPLIEIQRHGDLIDRDAMLDMMERAKEDPQFKDDYAIVRDWLCVAPIVIEAEVRA